MRLTIALLALVAFSAPSMAANFDRSSLTDSEKGAVMRQCAALKALANRSLADSDGDPPPAGQIEVDPANPWADGADPMDEATTPRINLAALTLADCREAGF